MKKAKPSHSLKQPVSTLTGLVLILLSLFAIVFYYFIIDKSTLLRTDAREPRVNSRYQVQPAQSKQAQAIKLNSGWNYISFYVFEDLYASSICAKSANITRVGRHLNPSNSFEEYDCENPTSINFRLTPNVGYFILATKTETLNISGTLIPYFTDIQPGFNSVGLSPDPGAPALASDLCGDYRGTNLKVTEVYRWYNNGWSVHLCDKPFNKFSLEVGVGYIVKAEHEGETLNLSLPSIGQ